MTNNTNRQYNLLQVLRAYAAFLVIYEHLFGSYIDLVLKQHNFYSDFISNFIFKPLGIIDYGGGLGVVQFFVLSGFVISMVATRESRIEFMTKRFFRIFPPILFSLSLISLLYLSLYFFNLTSFIDMYSDNWPSLVSWKDFTFGYFLRNLFLLKVDLNMVMWTLRIEIAFYIIIFLALPYMKKSPNIFFLSAILFFVIIAFFEVDQNSIYYKVQNELKYLQYLFLGALMFFWFDKRINNVKFIIFLFIFILLLYKNSLFRYVFLSYFLLFAGIYFNDKIKVPNFLVYLGNISYSTYLNHQTICTILIGIMLSKIKYSDENMLVIFILMLFLIFFISVFSYKFIEKPSQIFARNLLKKIKR